MKRRMIVLGLAFLLAVLGTGAVYVYVRQADSRAVVGKQAVSVLIANDLVPAGTVAGEAGRRGLLRTEKMPRETVSTDALTTLDAGVAQLVAGADIQPGQLVLRSMFVTRKVTTSGLAIPAGKIAVTVQFTVVQEVAGHIVAGSHVVVFDTYTVVNGQDAPTGDGLPKAPGDVQATRVLLPDVEVLAVGLPVVASTAKDKPAADPPSDTVLLTVAADQRQAERLILRAQTGSLHLALRGEDSDIPGGPGVNTRSLGNIATIGS
jgi:pilus assembly protein CpaB